jgi:ABC-type branched-subunit amino acid transport system substrate-binding protein
VAPFEGRYRYAGYDLFSAVRQAVREANTVGGVGGVGQAGSYAIELVAFDDGADPEMAAQQARKLAQDPQILAVIGHFREGTTRAALPIYVEAGLPLLAPSLLDPSLEGGDGLLFRLGPDARPLAASLLDGVDRAALVGGGAALGQALQEVAAERRVHLNPVVFPAAPDWLEMALAADPPVVLCEMDPVTAGEVLAALRAAGWGGEFRGGPDLAAADFRAVAGEAAEGTLFATPWRFPQDVEGGADFASAYAEVSGGVLPGPLALPAYEAARLALEALEADIARHGAPTRAGVAAALETLAGEWDDRANGLWWYRIQAGGVAELLRTAPP